MPQRPAAEGTGDGGHEADEVYDNKRANARASSKGKEDAAGPASSKKRKAPVGVSTIKAAKKKKKKKKTSAPACQVRSDMIRIPLVRRSRTRTANTQRVNVIHEI